MYRRGSNINQISIMQNIKNHLMHKIRPCALNQLYEHVRRGSSNNYVHPLTKNALISSQKLHEQILSETKSTNKHLTPELHLNLITSECHLWNAHPENAPFHEPYWGFYWPGGQALTRCWL